MYEHMSNACSFHQITCICNGSFMKQSVYVHICITPNENTQFYLIIFLPIIQLFLRLHMVLTKQVYIFTCLTDNCNTTMPIRYFSIPDNATNKINCNIYSYISGCSTLLYIECLIRRPNCQWLLFLRQTCNISIYSKQRQRCVMH